MKTTTALTYTAGTIAILAVAVLGLYPLTTAADTGLYGGALYGEVQYEEGQASLDMGASSLILGVSFNDYVASECRYGTGSSDSLYGTTLKLDNYYGCYVLFQLPVNQYITPYIIGGYTKAEATVSNAYHSSTDTGSGSSLGFGIKSELNNHFSLRLERLELIDKDGYTLEQTSLAALWQF